MSSCDRDIVHEAEPRGRVLSAVMPGRPDSHERTRNRGRHNRVDGLARSPQRALDGVNGAGAHYQLPISRTCSAAHDASGAQYRSPWDISSGISEPDSAIRCSLPLAHEISFSR
jgi:hypothetical protein